MSPIDGWSDQHANTVRALINQIRSEAAEATPLEREASLCTDGLPVYMDLGGCLLITPDGSVLEFAPETAAVSVVTDPSWIRVARTAAAERYEALAGLRPRGETACPTCGGKGFFGSDPVRCGTCGGTGRV